MMNPKLSPTVLELNLDPVADLDIFKMPGFVGIVSYALAINDRSGTFADPLLSTEIVMDTPEGAKRYDCAEFARTYKDYAADLLIAMTRLDTRYYAECTEASFAQAEENTALYCVMHTPHGPCAWLENTDYCLDQLEELPPLQNEPQETYSARVADDIEMGLFCVLFVNPRLSGHEQVRAHEGNQSAFQAWKKVASTIDQRLLDNLDWVF